MSPLPNPLEQGASGLWYLTDPQFPGMFIAARTPELALQASVQAAIALQGGPENIPGHALYERGGALLTVPTAPMTESQRQETIARMQRHIARRLLQ